MGTPKKGRSNPMEKHDYNFTGKKKKKTNLPTLERIEGLTLLSYRLRQFIFYFFNIYCKFYYFFLVSEYLISFFFCFPMKSNHFALEVT